MTVEWHGNEIIAKIRQAAMRGVIRGTELVRTEMLTRILQGGKSGRLYTKSNPRRVHRASAPGEAPASDLGDLVRGISTSYDHVNLSGTITSSAAHSAALEYGTVKMAPRPFARPSLIAKRDEIVEDIAREIRTALGG